LERFSEGSETFGGEGDGWMNQEEVEGSQDKQSKETEAL
jgi:hypothetical protein